MRRETKTRRAPKILESIVALNALAVNPPIIAPSVVVVSRTIPRRTFANLRSTFTEAAVLDVAITQTMLVAIAWWMGIFKNRTKYGMRKIPPPIPRRAPRSPAMDPPKKMRRKEVKLIDWGSFL